MVYEVTVLPIQAGAFSSTLLLPCATDRSIARCMCCCVLACANAGRRRCGVIEWGLEIFSLTALLVGGACCSTQNFSASS